MGTIVAWCQPLGAQEASAEPVAPARESSTPEDGPHAPEGPAPQASDATPPTSSESERVQQARRHFDNGVRLYRDSNYSAALVEFEAAMKLKPGASSLSNIALCQKALFRYAAAASTLEQLLARYGATLSNVEHETVRAALVELTALTRQVLFQVSPEGAVLTLDGQVLGSNDKKQGVRLNVGEHEFSTSAPGYATDTRLIRVSSGQEPLVVEVQLAAVAGFVTIVTEEKGAAIAIDGRALDYDRWSGPLEPGEHLLQIYKTGHQTVEELFEVGLGENKLIRASAGGALEESAADPPPTSAAKQRGWYGLGTFNLMLVPDAPDGVRVDNSFNSGALAWGGRAGYRLLDPLGVELLIEQGVTGVTDACIEDESKWQGVNASCNDTSGMSETLEYVINAFRLGGNLRVFSSGSRARFTSSLGFGGVTHNFELRRPSDSQGQFDAQALNAYVLVEVGAQFNWGRLLLEADFVTYVESRGSLGGDDHELFNEGGLKSLGFGIKAGWSDWRPH